MTSPMVIRFQFSKADKQALRCLEAQYDETVVSGRIGPEGERQVRCHSGEVYNLDALRATRRPGPDTDPLPPAPAVALVA